MSNPSFPYQQNETSQGCSIGIEARPSNTVLASRLSYCQCGTCLPCIAQKRIAELEQDNARYENGRVILLNEIEDLKTKLSARLQQIEELTTKVSILGEIALDRAKEIDSLQQKLKAAEQLAVRQGNEIRKLRSGESA